MLSVLLQARLDTQHKEANPKNTAKTYKINIITIGNPIVHQTRTIRGMVGTIVDEVPMDSVLARMAVVSGLLALTLEVVDFIAVVRSFITAPWFRSVVVGYVGIPGANCLVKSVVIAFVLSVGRWVALVVKATSFSIFWVIDWYVCSSTVVSSVEVVLLDIAVGENENFVGRCAFIRLSTFALVAAFFSAVSVVVLSSMCVGVGVADSWTGMSALQPSEIFILPDRKVGIIYYIMPSCSVLWCWLPTTLKYKYIYKYLLSWFYHRIIAQLLLYFVTLGRTSEWNCRFRFGLRIIAD